MMSLSLLPLLACGLLLLLPHTALGAAVAAPSKKPNLLCATPCVWCVLAAVCWLKRLRLSRSGL